MCTSTVLAGEAAVAGQSVRVRLLVTVVLSGIATSVSVVAVQPGALFTPTVRAAALVTDGAVAVIVTGALERGVPSAAVMVAVVDSPAVTVAGVNVMVTPVGVAPAVKVTGSGSPLTAVVD